MLEHPVPTRDNQQLLQILQNLVQHYPNPHLDVVDVNVVLGILLCVVCRSVSVGGLVVFRGLLLLTAVIFLLLQRGKIMMNMLYLEQS